MIVPTGHQEPEDRCRGADARCSAGRRWQAERWVPVRTCHHPVEWFGADL